MPGVETIVPGLGVLLLAAATMLVAEAVYVLLGFGAGLIAVGVLALILPDLGDVVVMVLLVSLPAELWVVFTTWREICWRGVLRLGIGVAVGIPLGTAFLKLGDPRLLVPVLGAVIALTGAAFLFLEQDTRLSWPPWTAPVAGLVAGVLSGLFGTGAPPLVIYHRLTGAAKTRFRGSMMAVFLLMTFVRLPAYAVAGLLTMPRLLMAALMLPAVALGAFIGHHVQRGLDEAVFRRAVAAGLMALGLVVVLGG